MAKYLNDKSLGGGGGGGGETRKRVGHDGRNTGRRLRWCARTFTPADQIITERSFNVSLMCQRTGVGGGGVARAHWFFPSVFCFEKEKKKIVWL